MFIKWLLTFNQINQVIVDFNIIRKLNNIVRKEYICKLNILRENTCKNFI